MQTRDMARCITNRAGHAQAQALTNFAICVLPCRLIIRPQILRVISDWGASSLSSNPKHSLLLQLLTLSNSQILAFFLTVEAPAAICMRQGCKQHNPGLLSNKQPI